MTCSMQLGTAEEYAQSLLAAWNDRDLPQFNELFTALASVAAASLPPAEQERIDLVQEIGRRLLSLEASQRVKTREEPVALGLLRHLAGSQA